METEPDHVENAAHALEKTIRAEIVSMVEGVRGIAARARRLGSGARAINGLAAATAVWSRDLEVIATKLDDELPEVTKALLGSTPVEITESVNPALAAAVTADRKRSQ